MQQKKDKSQRIQVVFPLDKYFQKSGAQKQYLQKAVQKLRQAFKHEFKKIAKYLHIELLRTKGYFSKYSNQHNKFKENAGLLFQVQQVKPQILAKLYFQLEKLFNERSIVFFSLDSIVNQVNLMTAKQRVEQQNMDLILIEPKTIGIINYNSSKIGIPFLKSLLTTSKHLISISQFDLQEIKMLIQENHEVKSYIMKKCNRLSYTYQQIDKQSFSVTCDLQNYRQFIQYAKAYLSQNKREHQIVSQFQSEFQINLFFKFYQEQIKNQFPTLIFYQQQGKLYRKNKAVQDDQIYDEIKTKKKEMCKNLIKIPSNFQISSKNVQVIKNSFFCKEIIIRSKKYLFMKKIPLFVKSFHSLNSYEENIIFIINNKDYCHCFKKILNENGYNINNHINESNSRKYKGIHEFRLQKSRFLNSVLMCTIERTNKNRIDQTKLIQNIHELVQKLTNEKEINLVFPTDVDELLVYTFIKILKQQIRMKSFDRLKKLNILLQDQNQEDYKRNLILISKSLQVNKQLLQITKQSSFYLSAKDIQKLFFLQLRQVKYSNMHENNLSTFSLSCINSYILNLNIRKNSQSNINIPVFLVETGKYEYQYVINVSNGEYYKLDLFGSIIQGNVSQNQQLKKMTQTIKKYFQNITYFVIYEGKQNKILTDNLYLHLTEGNQLSKERLLKKIMFSQDLSKVKNCKQKNDKTKQMVFVMIQKNHLNTYEIHTHKQFQRTIKKEIVNLKK